MSMRYGYDGWMYVNEMSKLPDTRQWLLILGVYKGGAAKSMAGFLNR